MKQIDNILYANEGKVLRLKVDGSNWGSEVSLGKLWYYGDKYHDEPIELRMDSFEEVEEHILNDGTVVYTIGDTIKELKDALIDRITEYDSSSAVNSFSLQGNAMWLDKATRVGLMNSIEIEKASGHEITVLWYGGNSIAIPIEVAIQMLSQLELYALSCYNVTAEHKAAVNKLEDVESIEQYDYAIGYPEKLTFNY